jgi:hypothetical protein
MGTIVCQQAKEEEDGEVTEAFACRVFLVEIFLHITLRNNIDNNKIDDDSNNHDST